MRNGNRCFAALNMCIVFYWGNLMRRLPHRVQNYSNQIASEMGRSGAEWAELVLSMDQKWSLTFSKEHCLHNTLSWAPFFLISLQFIYLHRTIFTQAVYTAPFNMCVCSCVGINTRPATGNTHSIALHVTHRHTRALTASLLMQKPFQKSTSSFSNRSLICLTRISDHPSVCLFLARSLCRLSFYCSVAFSLSVRDGCWWYLLFFFFIYAT